MALLPNYDTPGFPDVYELAVEDPVAGGPDGVDNLPHKQLKERTDFLKARIDEAVAAQSTVAGRVLSLEASSAGSVGRAVPLSWEYSDKGFDFELFAAGFEWRDMTPVTVAQTVAGDESVDVSSTAELQVGATYVIYTATGVAHTVTVDAILSPVRFRATEEMTASLSGATLSRTSWKVEPGRALAADRAVMYSRPIKTLRLYADGRVVIRRSDSDGTLALQYRPSHIGAAWREATLLRTVSRSAGTRDEEWRVEGGSDLDLRIEALHGASGKDIVVTHMAAFPGEEAGRAFEVAQPINQTPEDQAVAQLGTPTLIASAFRSLYGIAQADAEFRIGSEPEMTNVIWSSMTGAPATSIQVANGALDTDRAYFWQARYRDAEGAWSPWSMPTAFSTGSVFQYVQQPINTSPAAGSTAASSFATLQATAFAVIGGADTHQASQWQVASDAAFTTLVHDSGETMTDLTSHAIPAGALNAQATYYFRVRYKGAALGYSPWSKATNFTTQAVPSAPTITAPTDAATGVSRTPTLASTAFFISGATDSHSKSQWQIASNSNFTTIVYDTGETTDLTSHTVAAALAQGTTYYVRARHKGLATGFGPWSNAVTFATLTAQVMGVALLTEGGNGGSWTFVDQDGAAISAPAASYFNSHPVWGGVQDVTIDGQAMVKIPKFYVRRATISAGVYSGKQAWWISDQPQPGFRLHSAFRNAGVEVDQVYVGKYQASLSGSKLASVSGVTPAVSRSLTQFQADAAARNVSGVTGFMLWSAFQWSAIQWLYLVENATMDSQTKTGQGRVNASSAASVSATDVAQATYRGIVGLWGNVWQWMDGLKTVNGNVNLWDQDGNKSWVSTKARAAASGTIYPTTFMDGQGTGWDLEDVFIGDTGPTSNSNATAPDYQYITNTGEYFPFVGGNWSYAATAGLWCVLVNDSASSTVSNIGARLAKV